MARKTRLYRKGGKARSLKSFKARYGARKGARVFGAVVGKVKREQAAKHSGVLIEEVKRHTSHSKKGTPFIVRRHKARVRA